MLTKEQYTSFNKEGILLVPNFFLPHEINAWKHEWLIKNQTSVGVSDDLASYTNNKLLLVLKYFKSNVTWSGNQHLVLRDSGSTYLPFSNRPDSATVTLNSLFYLQSIKSKTHKIQYWPKSHSVTEQYLINNTDSHQHGADFNQSIEDKLLPQIHTDVVELAVKVGDLLLWHPLLWHSHLLISDYDELVCVEGDWHAEDFH